MNTDENYRISQRPRTSRIIIILLCIALAATVYFIFNLKKQTAMEARDQYIAGYEDCIDKAAEIIKDVDGDSFPQRMHDMEIWAELADTKPGLAND